MMQFFAVIDLAIRLFQGIRERVKRQEEEDAERLQNTKRSFFERITKRKTK